MRKIACRRSNEALKAPIGIASRQPPPGGINDEAAVGGGRRGRDQKRADTTVRHRWRLTAHAVLHRCQTAAAGSGCSRGRR